MSRIASLSPRELRNTWDYSIRTNYVLNPTTFAVTSVRGGPGTPDGEGSWTALSYTLGARYQLNDDTMFFITNSKGHSSGGLQNVAGNEKFDPDSLNNIEVGAKTTFDLGSAVSVRVNAAAHYGWFDDVKVAQLILTTIPGTTGTTFVSATTNAAKAIVKGADLDVTAVVAERLEVSANVNYSKNNYTEYTSFDANTGAVIDLSDTPFPNNPEWKYAISATYHLPFDEERIGDISIGADYNWADEHWIAVGGECKARRTAANGYGPLSADGGWAYKNCVPDLAQPERSDQLGSPDGLSATASDPLSNEPDRSRRTDGRGQFIQRVRLFDLLSEPAAIRLPLIAIRILIDR